mmetsp:Transcript_26410/g.61443  ORF Transcript_26410/g.61443 Transcript_26410/m.61443 type:complete len:434 (+) Transcript_26410:133-1434(+)
MWNPPPRRLLWMFWSALVVVVFSVEAFVSLPVQKTSTIRTKIVQKVIMDDGYDRSNFEEERKRVLAKFEDPDGPFFLPKQIQLAPKGCLFIVDVDDVRQKTRENFEYLFARAIPYRRAGESLLLVLNETHHTDHRPTLTTGGALGEHTGVLIAGSQFNATKTLIQLAMQAYKQDRRVWLVSASRYVVHAVRRVCPDKLTILHPMLYMERLNLVRFVKNPFNPQQEEKFSSVKIEEREKDAKPTSPLDLVKDKRFIERRLETISKQLDRKKRADKTVSRRLTPKERMKLTNKRRRIKQETADDPFFNSRVRQAQTNIVEYYKPKPFQMDDEDVMEEDEDHEDEDEDDDEESTFEFIKDDIPDNGVRLINPLLVEPMPKKSKQFKKKRVPPTPVSQILKLLQDLGGETMTLDHKWSLDTIGAKIKSPNPKADAKP